MSLTVPTAGLSAGRAAQVRIATPDTGDIIGQFGALVQQKGQAIKAAQGDMLARRTQLDMTRDLGQARLELEQSSDPDQIDVEWPARATAIREKYLGVGPDGQPLIADPEVAANLDLTLTELSDRHALALGGKAIGLRQSQQEAAYIAFNADLTNEAARADTDSLEALIGMGEAAIDQRLANGIIDPAKAASEKLALRQTIFSARATEQINADPEAFLADADAGQYGSLGAETLASRRVTAQNEIDRRAAAEAKAAEVAQSERSTAIGKRLSEMTDMMAAGFAVTDEAYLADAEVQAHPGFAEAMAAQSLRNELPNIRLMTPAELDAQIATEMAAPKTAKYQTERVKILRTWRDTAATRADSDYVSLAQEAEIPVPELPDFDPADPDAFTAGLAARLGFDKFAVEKGHTRTQAVLSQPERAALQTVLAPTADAAPKVALVRSLLQASGGNPTRLTAVIGADPVVQRVTKLMGSTRDEGLATEILRGQQKAETKTVIMPTPRDQARLFDEATGGAFDAYPGLKAEIMAASTALYADGAAGIDAEAQSGTGWLTDATATDLYTRSIQRVIGALPDANGELTIGGVQQIRDSFVALPQGVAKRDVEDALDAVAHQLSGDVYDPKFGWGGPMDGSTPDMMRAFKAASIDGRLPDLGDDPMEEFPNLQIQRVMTKAGGETDQYRLVSIEDGSSTPIRDIKGVEYRFRLPDLIRGAAQ